LATLFLIRDDFVQNVKLASFSIRGQSCQNKKINKSTGNLFIYIVTFFGDAKEQNKLEKRISLAMDNSNYNEFFCVIIVIHDAKF
jgi:hypothetical protein